MFRLDIKGNRSELPPESNTFRRPVAMCGSGVAHCSRWYNSPSSQFWSCFLTDFAVISIDLGTFGDRCSIKDGNKKTQKNAENTPKMTPRSMRAVPLSGRLWEWDSGNAGRIKFGVLPSTVIYE